MLLALAVVGVSAWGLAESITATNDLVRWDQCLFQFKLFCFNFWFL